MLTEQPRIAVIGLGDVGLPLARLFATKFPVIGFDINQSRIEELREGRDSTLEVEDKILQAVLLETNPVLKQVAEVVGVSNDRHPELSSGSAVGEMDNGLFVTSGLNAIEDCNYYIITVPTPIDKNNRPDLTPLYKSSEAVASVLKKKRYSDL